MTTLERNLAQAALNQLENVVLSILKQSNSGLRTGEVATILGIESHCPRPNSNWLARTILESLVSKGKVKSEKMRGARVFQSL